MVTIDEFLAALRVAVPRFAQHPPNPSQERCIRVGPSDPLMIVAGPGSGKTTVLVLRALRLVFVDDYLPEEILVTTFTRKAADEIRSRIIEWGLALKRHFEQPQFPHLHATLAVVDINRFVTGTLDSICEDVLARYRDPSDAAPVLVEGFVGNALLAREGLFPTGAHNNQALSNYLANFTFEATPPRNFGETVSVTRTVVDRLIQDRVDIPSFEQGNPFQLGREAVSDALASYRQYMDSSQRMDFARLEELFLERVQLHKLNRFLETVRAIFVDEYQDTNPLQEDIYFTLVRMTSASFTIVGDDDQSLYRFRGATVELFRDFVTRFLASQPGGRVPIREYLVENYRSTPEIINHFNRFLSNNQPFASARVQPTKPVIVAQLPSRGIPVLGMFRPTAGDLARDLAQFLQAVFRGPGHPLQVNGTPVVLRGAQPDGDLGDALFLGHSVNEFASSFGQTPPRARLPKLLRDELQQRQIQVFNPRGRALRDLPIVQQLLGLILECIDPPTPAAPMGAAQDSSRALRGEARTYLGRWRTEARAFVSTNPTPNQPHRLADFVRSWQTRQPQAGMTQWPREWPLLELCFKLITWLPQLHDDPEGQVYLEAVARCIAQAATYSSYRSMIITGDPVHAPRSVMKAIVDILAPLAESDVEVDEEIMPSVPRNRMPFMTIHQAKGLEYPLVIVDVASDYTRNHPKNKFKRFPDAPSAVQNMEDDLAPYSHVGPLRLVRSALDRTFDDLIRLYYVAYSRPQSVLLLVGIDKCLQYGTTIRHVGLGWASDGSWAWRTPVAGRPPALVNSLPIQLI